MSGSSSVDFDTKSNVSVQDNGVQVDGGFSSEIKNAKGYGLSFGINGHVDATTNLSSNDGVTTYTAQTQASLTIEGGVSAPTGGLQGTYTLGSTSTYTVAMPEAAATPQAISTANPFDPASMPPGTKITMDGSTYQSTAFEATFRGISVGSDIQTSSGASFIVQKNEDGTIQVMTGPTEGLDAVNTLGADLGVASAELSSSFSVKDARYQVANFDINTAEGRAAYNAFLTTGQMPTDNAAGVSGVYTISTGDTDWSNAVSVSLGPLHLGGQLDSAEGKFVTITYPDGSVTATATYRSTDGGPTTIWEQHLRPDGTEIVEDRRYNYVFQIPDDQQGTLLASAINYALNGRSSEVVSPGDTVTLTFTEQEMAQLLQMAASQSQQDKDYGEYELSDDVLENESGTYVGNYADSRLATPWEFANNLVDSRANMWQVADTLASISTHAGEGVTLKLDDRVDVQATVTVNGDVVVEGQAAKIDATQSQAESSTAAGGGGGARPMAVQ